MSDKMKKIPIQGNDYITVHERVMEFHRQFENGSIKTEVVELTESRFITLSTVTPDVEVPDRCFTGIACETITDVSDLENCETSSVGRALGFCNIGINTSIASYDEVTNYNAKTTTNKDNKPLSVEDWNGEDVISFGKHNGIKWKDCDRSYVNFIADGTGKFTVCAIAELKRREDEDKEKAKNVPVISKSDSDKGTENTENVKSFN